MEASHTMSGLIGSVTFGIPYGFMLAYHFGDKENWRAYFSGKWIYMKKRNIIFKILLYILFGGFFGGIFIVLIPHFIENIYAKYLIACFGGTTSAIGLIFLAPSVAMKFSVIYCEEDYNANSEILEDKGPKKSNDELIK